jgi:sulfur carrier protein ThiS adenylyltransferase
MQITINSHPTNVPAGSTLAELAVKYHPGADLMILNSYPASPDTVPDEGDELFLIRRGEQPAEHELESLMAARHTPGVHQRLKQSVVGIAGVGGLGSTVAVALARIGIGRLVLADFDLVEPSNLNRQQFFVDQIGQAKVLALTDTLLRVNPYLCYEPHEIRLDPKNIPSVFADCQIIIEAFDLPEMKAMLVDTVLEQLPKTVVVAASGMAGYGDSNNIITRKVSERFYLVGDGSSEARPGSGLMAPRVAVCAGHQANLAVQLILGDL